VISLALDASTYMGTVAVFRDDALVAEAEAPMRGEHREGLMPATAEALRRADLVPSDLQQIVCGAGPGSFTSLRIAASIAKGLAFAVEIPLLAVSSLALIAAGRLTRPGRYLTVLDALRGELYIAGFQVETEAVVAQLLPPRLAKIEELSAIADSIGATPIGPGVDGADAPHARNVLALRRSDVAPAVVDLATWEPTYGRKAEAQVRWEAVHAQPLTLE
jgi:tRNA threonylcarbamoyladenosine biosynthesis protein TsaB